MVAKAQAIGADNVVALDDAQALKGLGPIDAVAEKGSAGKILLLA